MARIDQLSYYPALTERIRALAGQGLGSAAIAGELAANGFRTPRLHERFHPGEIQQLIRRLACVPAWTTTTAPIRAASSLASGGWLPWPARSACGGDPVRMAQTRLGHRPARHPAALPVDHHRGLRRGRAPPRAAPAAGQLPQPAQLD